MTVELTGRSVETTAAQIQLMGLPSVDVPPGGHTQTLTWRGVAGATGARVAASSVTVVPTTGGAGRSLGVVASAKSRVKHIEVASPVAGALLRGLRIPGLVRHDGEHDLPVAGAGDLPGNLHLVLTPVVGGRVQAPVVAVPPLPARKALPAQLTGGSLTGSLFSLPDLVGATFRVTLVEGDAPQDFDEQTFSHGDVVMYAAPMPVGLHIDGPDGTEIFALAGAIASTATVDLKAALGRHLDAAFAEATGAAPVTAVIGVRSDVLGKALVRWSVDGGVVERAVEGRLTAEVDGSSATITLPPPRPGRAAARTLADVTVTHHGMAIHPLSDPMPVTDAGLGGPTVRGTAVVRALPLDALRGQTLTRLGVVGWPRGETDLTLEVLGATASLQGLGPSVDRDPPTLVWFDVGPVPVDRPVEVRLTATKGAFGWVADPHPLIRIAVTVTPQGERVTVGGHAIDLTGEETAVTGVVLAGTDGWQAVTDQFCTVSIANAVMEFAP